MKIYIETLGCAKNTAEIENVLIDIDNAAYEFTGIPGEADIMIVHTCAFIEQATKESIGRILSLAKNKSKSQKLIVTGCIVQRYKSELEKLLPEIDKFVGTGELGNLVNIILKQDTKRLYLSSPGGYLESPANRHLILPNQPWKYVRIAEGCNNNCSFCIIPQLRGKYRSRTMENIVSEIKYLIDNGIKEINIIGQDIGLYGVDIYGTPSLTKLLKEILKIKKYFWLRLLYIHPKHVTNELISLIANEDRICNYLDMPVEHISDKLLSLCRRHVTKKETYKTIEKLHNKIPGFILRTSLILGLPEETKKDMDELKELVNTGYIQRLGIFEYSPNETSQLTRTYPKYKVNHKLFDKNNKELLSIYTRQAVEYNKSLTGKKTEALICSKNTCRDYRYAPEVDGEMVIGNPEGKKNNIGEFTSGTITEFRKMLPIIKL